MPADLSLLVERHTAEWFRAQAVVPGAEVHDDPDVTWVVSPGSAWSNTGTMVRLTPRSAAERLDTLLSRYRRNGRGMGLWVSPAATPPQLAALLRERGLRCRKLFPAMLRGFDRTPPALPPVAGLEVRPVDDVGVFEDLAHPTIGPLTTGLRRFEHRRLGALLAVRPATTFGFVAWLGGVPVGASLLFLGSETSGLHDLTVLEAHRGRGIGRALLEETCLAAARRGATGMVLLATSEGQPVYERVGFREVARFGYWYRSFQRRGPHA